MTAHVDQDQACAALGVDAFGLERLIALGDLIASGAPGARRRAEALAELVRIDGPYLAHPGRDAGR